MRLRSQLLLLLRLLLLGVAGEWLGLPGLDCRWGAVLLLLLLLGGLGLGLWWAAPSREAPLCAPLEMLACTMTVGMACLPFLVPASVDMEMGTPFSITASPWSPNAWPTRPTVAPMVLLAGTSPCQHRTGGYESSKEHMRFSVV
jgi:hypothetical protein